MLFVGGWGISTFGVLVRLLVFAVNCWSLKEIQVVLAGRLVYIVTRCYKQLSKIFKTILNRMNLLS